MVKRILVVEDEAPIRYAMEICLERAGYEIIEAHNGSEVLDLILDRSGGQSPIDLVLLDLQMPECSGLEVMAKLGAIEDCPPIVVVSGTIDTDELGEVDENSNCCGILNKPFTAEKLLRVVADVFDG